MSDQQLGAADLGFELVPPDENAVSPLDDLNAAAASAVSDPGTAAEAAVDPVEPFGVSWAFDYVAGRFKRQGTSPGRVEGTSALVEWCMTALNSRRYAHAIFSDEFGMEKPQGTRRGLPAGRAAEEYASDWGAKAREALLVHDRIVNVAMTPLYDPVKGLITIDNLVVVTDEDVELAFPDLQIATE